MTQNPRYVQAILSRNPMVIALLDGDDHVYAAPLYARPVLSLDAREVYPEEDLLLFAGGYDERPRIDSAIKRCHDPSLRAKVHRYRGLSSTMSELEDRLIVLERHWGELAAAKLSCIRRLEMANALARIEEVGRDEIITTKRRGRHS